MNERPVPNDLGRNQGGWGGDVIGKEEGEREGTEEQFSTLMSAYKKTKTRFSQKVRVDPVALEWMRQNKDTRTVAGFLDKIINNYKKHHAEARRPASQTATQTNFEAPVRVPGALHSVGGNIWQEDLDTATHDRSH